MPRRNDINKILIIGSGPIVIGQGCEFDYSGTQACKALRRMGYQIVLVNSNPATIMTDPEIADATYIEPLNVKSLKAIIAKEQPDAVLPNLGGQMALNLCSELSDQGILEEYGVQVIGVQVDAIQRGEDRIEFKKTMEKLGIDMPRSRASYTVEEAELIAEELGYPVVIRPAFTMGGTGGGLVSDVAELRVIAARGIAASMVGQILIEESVLGWEELELEVVRDSKNQMITVCFIENIDAVGVHTGDSICCAPMLTISGEVQRRLQKHAYDVVEAIGVIGGTNVQFAHDPATGRIVIIEINPRTSRSSALASKATGFPIAYVSAMLAAGMTLDEIPYWRDGTLDRYTPCGDHVVIKYPRWAFEKFPGSMDQLGTQMRAVGEVMSIGKNYKEALQKAVRSLEIGRWGLGFAKNFHEKTLEELLALLKQATSERQFILYEAIRKGASLEELFAVTYIKPYYLEQMQELVALEEEILNHRGSQLPDALLLRAKRDGFADRYLAMLLDAEEAVIRAARTRLGAVESWEAVPVSGVEDASYYFSTYNGIQRQPGDHEPDSLRKTHAPDRPKVMILGGGPNRIGQGIEFDYCCVHAAFALRDLGIETVMVNCNPETVSTDYDTSDRLYFEPLTVEDVLSIYEKEQPLGVIVSFGGQTPLNIAGELEQAGARILGTSQRTIDLAEDRDLFGRMMEKLNIPMPESGMAVTEEEALRIAHRIGYPLMVRPSYVLGGRGMKLVYDDEMLARYMAAVEEVSEDRPILIDRFLKDATEVEADAIADGENAFVPTVMEHIEYAGIHSGDSACVIPPISISQRHLETIVEYTTRIAREMKVIGLMNMQYAIEGNRVYVLEANPRGSRTVPLVSKVCNIPMARIATDIIMAAALGGTYDMNALRHRPIRHFGVKEAILPFNMFPEVRPDLGPEMRSTGEVLGMADSFELAYAKAQESTHVQLPAAGTVLFSVNDNDKGASVQAARAFTDIGFQIRATRGTCAHLRSHGIDCEEISKLHEGHPNIADRIAEGAIDLIINTPSSRISGFAHSSIGKLAVKYKIPYITTMTAALASARGIGASHQLKTDLPEKKSLQEYHSLQA